METPLQFATAELFGMQMAVYVGGCYPTAPLVAAQSEFRTVKAICSILCIFLGDIKESPPARSALQLVAHVPRNGMALVAGLASRKRNGYRAPR